MNIASSEEEKKTNSLSLIGNPPPRKYDIDKIGSVAGLPQYRQQPDYIPYNPKGRDIYTRLTFNTGVMWLGGFALGGIIGIKEGWSKATNPSYKIRFNSVMNGLSKRGSNVGNTLGVLSFIYTSSIHVGDLLELDKMTDSAIATPIFGGAVTGAMFKSVRGPRAAALAGVIGAGLSTAYSVAGTYVYDIVLGQSGRF